MPGPLLTISATILCAHGGRANAVVPNPRLRMSGQAVPMSAAPLTVAGCPNPPPPSSQGPCLTAQWVSGLTTRVRSLGQPLLCQTGQAVAMPTGAPLNIAFPGQFRVKGS